MLFGRRSRNELPFPIVVFLPHSFHINPSAFFPIVMIGTAATDGRKGFRFVNEREINHEYILMYAETVPRTVYLIFI